MVSKWFFGLSKESKEKFAFKKGVGTKSNYSKMCCNDAIAYAKMCLPPINSATSLCKKKQKKKTYYWYYYKTFNKNRYANYIGKMTSLLLVTLKVKCFPAVIVSEFFQVPTILYFIPWIVSTTKTFLQQIWAFSHFEKNCILMIMCGAHVVRPRKKNQLDSTVKVLA